MMMRPDAPEPTAAAGPPPGLQDVEAGGFKVYYTVASETVDAASACLRVDFRDVLEWNRSFIPGLTRHARLKADTRLWLQQPPGRGAAAVAAADDVSAPMETDDAAAAAAAAGPGPGSRAKGVPSSLPPPPKRGDGGGLMDPPGVGGWSIGAAGHVEGAVAEDGGVKRKSDGGLTGDGEVNAAGKGSGGVNGGVGGVGNNPTPPPSKKRKSGGGGGGGGTGGKAGAVGDTPEEDIVAEMEATCVVKAAVVPVVVNGFKGLLAPASRSGAEEVTCSGGAEEVTVSMAEYLKRAGCGEGTLKYWRTTVLYDGDAGADAEEQQHHHHHQHHHQQLEPIGDWLKRKGASWGRRAIGNQLEILNAVAARAGVHRPTRASAAPAGVPAPAPAPGSSPGGTSWRAGEVVGYDAGTGEHHITLLDGGGGDVTCNLSLQTMRWLPSKYAPYAGRPEPPPDEGGIAYAMPPIPVGCGGMRGVLLPGGKRGDELVRYAAPCDRHSTTGAPSHASHASLSAAAAAAAATSPSFAPAASAGASKQQVGSAGNDGAGAGVAGAGASMVSMAEFTVPATEFERLGGKGTAKKWRQSLRLITLPGFKQSETMGKWLRTLGNLTGQNSIGRHIEIFWPSDNAFYGGTVAAYKGETGEHEVYYDDGGKEVLQLSMQTVRWGPLPPPGAREKIEAAAAAAGAGGGDGKKGGKKKTSGG